MLIQTADMLLIRPTLAWLGEPYDSVQARLMLLTIGQVESAFKTRVQAGGGPARGFFQFEKNGGCAEIEQHPKLAHFRECIRHLGFPVLRVSTHAALGHGADHLAVIMARAVLWLEPRPLPLIGDCETAYRQYLARWRPGKPSAARFRTSYAKALETVVGHAGGEE